MKKIPNKKFFFQRIPSMCEINRIFASLNMSLKSVLFTIFTFSLFKSSISSQKSEKYSYALNSQQKIYSTVAPAKASSKLNQSIVSLNYCSFFNNRAPSPQINLKNCTWYNENSCCLQSEIESTFSKVEFLF